MDSPAILTQGLTRRFGDFTAVEDVNLSVAAGQFYGFLGPNGAGKSTTIKMLTGLMAPTAGRMQILGLDLASHLAEVKSQIGVVPEGMALLGRLTGSEYLNFAGRMYGLDRDTAAQRAAELLDFMELASQPKTLITDYSHGMQKKLAMAAAVIHGPKVLFLEIVERLCTHVGIINNGRLVAQGSLDELRSGVLAGSATQTGERMTLEQYFLQTVGGSRNPAQELSWLG